MTLTLNLLVALLIALGVSVGLFLVGGRHDARATRALESAEAALATVEDRSAREALSAAAERWGTALAPIFRALRGHTGSLEGAIGRAAGLRIVLARRLVAPATFLLALGVVAGLLRRDRARDLVLYSSVTYSYIGKFLAISGIAYGVFVSLSPFAPSLWTLYPAIGITAAGAAVYAGNLPPKL
jgi:hypothetical protein